jgi:hypothetical protein
MVKRLSYAALLLGASGALGCSGESASSDDDDGTGMEDPGLLQVCAEYPGPDDPNALVDDLEDGDGEVADVGGRVASWWVVSDETAGGTITPAANAAPAPELLSQERCGSTYAMRLTGEGFTAWGATLVAGMNYDGASQSIQPVDLSGYRGLMFWARVGELHNSTVRVQFQDSNTEALGGVCNPEPSSPDECYNGWGTQILPLDTEWRLYRIPFRNLGQRDFGYRAQSFVTSAVYNIEWNLDPNAVFDLWIDDLWFY